VLASKVGAIPELIVTGHNGWLIPSHEVNTSTVRLGIELALSDKSRWQELSKSARSDAVSKFDIMRVADEFVRILRENSIE
jgi:glycosyltransferase involved in cell wall biosynthesis